MQVGDLIKEKDYPEVGLLLKIKDSAQRSWCAIMDPNGKVEWFTKAYIEEKCEVISSASR